MIKDAAAEGHPMFDLDGSDSVFMDLVEGDEDMEPKDAVLMWLMIWTKLVLVTDERC